MCLAVFVASSATLPLVPWNESRPGFHLRDLHPSDEVVKSRFSLPHVYRAGSHLGCGCGFAKGEGLENPALRQANYDAMAEWLSANLSPGGRVQIFSCERGDEWREPEVVETVALKALASPSFEFQEGRLIKIRRG